MQDAAITPPSFIARLTQLYRSLGPGILMATAAVGGSHLVASTQAGAIYGWQLVLLILLVNLFKYPFFLAGVQYTMATNKTLVQGYAEMGRPYLFAFLFITGFSAFVNIAALQLFSASLLAIFFPIELSITLLSAIVIITCLLILLTGHFKALDSVSKIIMALLTFSTVAAVLIAAGKPTQISPDFVPTSPWTLASLGFLVMTMGWMPAPIEVTSINSVWLKRQAESQTVTAKAAILDFNVGYIGTAVLAIVFLALGALLMHGSGTEVAMAGTRFAHQLVDIYASTIGEWARYLIAMIAFFCIFGSALTCLDGYPRVCAEATRLLFNSKAPPYLLYNIWVIGVAIGATLIIVFFTSALMPMLNFAMVLSFVTTPFIALLNYVLVSRTPLPPELSLSPALKGLSIFGLIYLFGFLAVFIWWQWLM